MMRQGVSLISVLVYIAGSSLICLLIMQYAAQSSSSWRACSRYIIQVLDAYAAIDVFARDVHTMKLLALTSRECVMQGTEKAVGWMAEKEILYRCHGRYDVNTQQWLSKKRERLASGIAACSFVPLRHQDELVGVTITIEGVRGVKKYTIERFVAMQQS